MFTYCFILLIFLFIYQVCTNARLKIIYFLFTFFLALLAGLRDENFGFDYNSYLMFINYIRDTDSLYTLFILAPIEPSFVFITWIISKLSPDLVFVFITFAFLGVFLKSVAIYKISPYPFLSLLLYYQSGFFSGDMAQIRQSVAITFFFFAVYFLSQKFNKKFFIMCGIATLFHFSAIFTLFPYFFNKIQWTPVCKLLLFLAIIFSFLFGMSGVSFVHIIGNIIPITYIQLKLVSYSDSAYSEFISFGVHDLIRLFISFSCLFFFKKQDMEDSLVKLVVISFIFGVIIFFFLRADGIFATRISSYYKMLDCFIFAFLLRKFIKVRDILGISLLLLVICIYAIVSFYLNFLSIPEFDNYHFIWDIL